MNPTTRFKLEKTRAAAKLPRMSHYVHLGTSKSRLRAMRTLGLLLAGSVVVTAGLAASTPTPLREQLTFWRYFEPVFVVLGGSILRSGGGLRWFRGPRCQVGGRHPEMSVT